MQSLQNNKKVYLKPAIIQELFLETKAGTPIEPVRNIQESNQFISPGDFSINNEP